MDMNHIAQAFGLGTFTYRNSTKENPARASVRTGHDGMEFEHSDAGQLIIRLGTKGVTLFRFGKQLYFKLGFSTDAGVVVKTAADISRLWPEDYLPAFRHDFLELAEGKNCAMESQRWEPKDPKERLKARIAALPEHLQPTVEMTPEAEPTAITFRHKTYDIQLTQGELTDLRIVEDNSPMPRSSRKKGMEEANEAALRTWRNRPQPHIGPGLEAYRFPELKRILAVARTILNAS